MVASRFAKIAAAIAACCVLIVAYVFLFSGSSPLSRSVEQRQAGSVQRSPYGALDTTVRSREQPDQAVSEVQDALAQTGRSAGSPASGMGAGDLHEQAVEPTTETGAGAGTAGREVVAAASDPDLTKASVRGVSDKEIRFGIVAPFSGSARELGRQMKLGIDTAFGVVNETGGVHGRLLKLLSADDGYEPSRTGAAVQQLFGREQVFGFVGNVGTPTAAVALPFALEHRMLFFGAFTGANLLRAVPPDHYVFNYRASYVEETEAAVRYLVRVRGIQPREIAVFAQQDAFGDAGFEGVAKAIRAIRPGYGEPILRLNYKRNTIDTVEAVSQLRSHKPPIKAVVMVATYRAAANFIEKTRDRYPKMTYTNVSFVGSTALADELLLQGPRFADGVIVTQVVPAVSGYSRAILDYRSALAKFFPGEAPDYVSLEGYIVGKLLIEGVRRAGPQLDTEKLIDTLESIHDLDLGLGTPLNFGPSEHQASHKVWGTQIDGEGHFKAIDLE
jgi:branched-chain amino acid transport system substrate-binding protein